MREQEASARTAAELLRAKSEAEEARVLFQDVTKEVLNLAIRSDWCVAALSAQDVDECQQRLKQLDFAHQYLRAEFADMFADRLCFANAVLLLVFV